MSQPVYSNKASHFFALLKQSLKGGEYDYTQGSIRIAIVLLAIPMILELSLESVFAVVDMYFVSHLPNSKNAIATVGLTESVVALVYTIAIGLSIAATAVVARRIGEKNPDGAAHAGAQSMVIALIVTVIISIAGIVFAADILRIMGASKEVIAEGTTLTMAFFVEPVMLPWPCGACGLPALLIFFYAQCLLMGMVLFLNSD